MSLPMELWELVLDSLSLVDLASCARVNCTISECALARLYRNINLDMFDQREDKQVQERSLKQQRNLLSTIAKRPDIGKHVWYFQNAVELYHYGKRSDATVESDNDIVLESAAKKMTRLRCAVLSRNVLATTILDSVTSYSHLRDLSLRGQCPPSFFRHNITMPLSRLRWEFLIEIFRGRQPNPIPRFLENAVKLCPRLISLELLNVAYSMNHETKHEVLPWPPESDNCLANLQQLLLEGVYDRPPEGHESSHEHSLYLPAFIERHRDSLKSLAVSVNADYTSANKYWVRKICAGLPELTSLTLHSESTRYLSQFHSQIKRVISELTRSHPRLERFSATSIGSHFYSSFGEILKPFTNLRYLRLGDGENRDGPFVTNPRINFVTFLAYDLIRFIQVLPPSLEELWLVINCKGLVLDNDEGFLPVLHIGPDIFKALRRLHTCDISAWTSGLHDIVGPYPKKAIHWRRSCPIANAAAAGPPSDKIKDILVSRLDRIDQENLPQITFSRMTVKLGNHDGVFEGDDAEDIWFRDDPGTHKSDFDPSTLGRTSRCYGDRVWPWRGHTVDHYPVYNRIQT